MLEIEVEGFFGAEEETERLELSASQESSSKSKSSFVFFTFNQFPEATCSCLRNFSFA